MSDYKKVEITRGIYSDIYNHLWADLRVFDTYSFPEGNEINPHEGRMYASWYVEGTDYPIIAQLRSWPLESREKTTVTYWLCIGDNADKEG